MYSKNNTLRNPKTSAYNRERFQGVSHQLPAASPTPEVPPIAIKETQESFNPILSEYDRAASFEKSGDYLSAILLYKSLLSGKVNFLDTIEAYLSRNKISSKQQLKFKQSNEMILKIGLSLARCFQKIDEHHCALRIYDCIRSWVKPRSQEHYDYMSGFAQSSSKTNNYLGALIIFRRLLNQNSPFLLMIDNYFKTVRWQHYDLKFIGFQQNPGDEILECIKNCLKNLGQDITDQTNSRSPGRNSDLFHPVPDKNDTSDPFKFGLNITV